MKEKSQKNLLQKPSDKWIELPIKFELKGQATQEKMELSTKLLIQADDIKRVSEHPTKMNRCLVALNDGANFEVEQSYYRLKSIVLEYV